MRWLLLKDLRILRRSPLLVALLVLYPVVLSVLIGAALSGGPQKPRVAFANLVPPGSGSISLGGRTLDASGFAGQLFGAIDPIQVHSRAAAVAKVRDGQALAAIVIPADAAQRLQGVLGLGGSRAPAVEVYYNADDPVKRRYVQDTIRSRLADANAAISAAVLAESARYLDLVVKGGKISIPFIGSANILGLRNAQTLINTTLGDLPKDSPDRPALAQVGNFAHLAADNLDLSKPILSSISHPVTVDQHIVSGSRTPLDAFAVVVAVTISMMFTTLLLAAGLLSLEREEQVFARLVRGLVTKTAILAEKGLLAGACALVLALAMLAALAGFVGLDWSRFGAWLLALAAGAAGFAALGTAIGAVTREVRAASLLAFSLALPLAFLALVPSGAVSPGLYDVLNVISGAFPYKPALRALDAAVGGGALLVPVLHLLALTAAFGAIGRVALRRF